MDSKGVTIIELLIVVVVMGIIAGISTIIISGVVQNAKQDADEAMLSSLNESMRLYDLTNTSTDDEFLELNSDEDRLIYLVESGFLSEIPNPQIETNSFVYNIEFGQWMIDGVSDVFESTAEEYFTISGNRITSYDNAGGINIVIPSMINGVEITGINGGAFKGLGLETVIIQEGITNISSSAFQENNIKSVIIPDSVERIWYNAFENNEISSVTFGKSVKRIDAGAFGNNNLTSISLPSSVNYVGEGAFGYGNNFITSITIGSNVQILNHHSFGWYGRQFMNYYKQAPVSGSYTYSNSSWS